MRRISFQGLLLGTLLAVSLGALLLASTMSFGVHRRVVDNLSDALVQQSLHRVTDRLDELVRMAVHHAELYPQLAPGGELTAEEFPQLFEQLWATVEPHHELSYLGVGIAETGEYAMVRNTGGLPLEIRMYVRDPGGPQIRDYVPTNAGLRLIRTTPWAGDADPQTSYELRLRPFYQQAVRARRSVWTDSYLFLGRTGRGDVPGVTFATPVYDADGRLKLVWDIDLELQSLSHFLDRVQGLILGRLLIVEHRTDGTWKVIAQPASETSKGPPSSECEAAAAAFLKRLPADFSEAAASSEQPALLNVDSRAWRMSYVPLKGPDRPRWIVAALNPLDAELPPAPFSSAGFVIAFGGVGLLATLCAWGVSRAIAAPLLTLERDARRLLDDQADTIAPLGGADEIGRLAATLNQLTHKVQQRQTSLEQSNRELEESRRRLQVHFDRTPVAAMEMDAEGRLLRWNAGAERVFGWAAAEVLGRRFEFIVPEPIRSDIEEVWRQLISRTGGFRNDNQNVTKNGRVIDCEWYNTPFHDEQGRVFGVACLVLDVTERTLADAEIRRLNADLERRVAERTTQLSRAVKELEAFSYSVAHDLRSPLRSISGFSQALQEDCGSELNAEGLAHLDRIRAATLRMSDLIDALLTLARVSRQELTQESVDLSNLAEQALARCRQQEPDRNVDTSVTPGLIVEGDRALLRIVINNLIDNAWKYTRSTPAASIEFGVQDGPLGREFFVRDNGVGFDPQYAGNLFQPFQRLHRTDEFEGHGVGLATVQRILDKHGGQVRLEGRVGEGAACFFTIGKATQE